MFSFIGFDWKRKIEIVRLIKIIIYRWLMLMLMRFGGKQIQFQIT